MQNAATWHIVATKNLKEGMGSSGMYPTLDAPESDTKIKKEKSKKKNTSAKK